MSPRRAASLLGAARAALGVAVLAAPETVTSRWLGADNASHPAVRYLARSLGVRDLALGVLVLSTLDDPRVASQVQAACAMADSVDALATIAVRSRLPRIGVVGTVTVAGAAAVVGFYLSRKLADA
jgi:hypothetical protein